MASNARRPHQEGTISLISKDLSIYSSDASCRGVTNPRSAYKLKNSSPAIDACGAGPDIDLDAVARPQRLSFDKEAFEMP
jgi:hypothetical protein